MLDRLASKPRCSSSNARAAFSEMLVHPASWENGVSKMASGARLPSRETRLLPTLACKSERNRCFARSLGDRYLPTRCDLR